MSVSILHANFLDILAELPIGSFDLILTDPPYGETSLAWDRWPAGWPAAVRPLLKPSGSMWVFGSQRVFFERSAEFVGWTLAQDIVWEKHNGSGFHADRFKRVHECALQFYRSDSSWAEIYKAPQYTNDASARVVRRKQRPAHMGSIEPGSYVSEDGGPRLMRSVIYARSEHGRALHPTQKPLGVVEPLLLYSCPPGGRVLDVFAGSGTVGVAAQRHGRDALLVEADPEYFKLAEERLSYDLFAEAAS